MDYELEELLPVVAWLSEKATGRESTSITYEKAKQLMEAVLFCIGQNETLDPAEEPLYITGPVSPKQAYERGYQTVIKKVGQAKKLYEDLTADFMSCSNRAYEDTVLKGMPVFFSRYDPRFAPQDHLLTLDYPVLLGLEHLSGIDRILPYLHCVLAEQTLLKKLPKPYVFRLLDSYDRRHRELFINPAELVVKNMLGFLLADAHVRPQGYGEELLNQIELVIMHHSKQELEHLLDQKLTVVLAGFDDFSCGYFKSILPGFSSELKHAQEHGQLSRLLV